MFKPKALNFEMDTADLSINNINGLYYTFFTSKDYDWWYEILPGDVVVDIGANIGMFSAKALDQGAEKVYMIEPSLPLLKTAVKNVSNYIIGWTDEPKVVPIHAAMGNTDVDLSNVYGGDEDGLKLMSFSELIETYNIPKIDYLKVNAAGAEYNILNVDNLNYLAQQTRVVAVRVHLDAQYDGLRKFYDWRNTTLKALSDLNRVFYQDNTYPEKIFADDWNDQLPRSFMIYIKNW